MHDDLLGKLAENLDQTIALYQELLATERRKQRAIVESNLEALTEVLGREEELVGRAEALEVERRGVRTALADREEGLEAGFRLEELLPLLEEPARGQLAARRQRLVSLAGELNEVNRLNFHLLRSSLAVVEGILSEVFGGGCAPPLYDAAGRQQAAERPATRLNQVL